MPPLDPEELLAQALQLARRPAQADLRRAISAAYYGLFHFFLTAAADKIVGADKRETSQYSSVYRSIQHSRLRAVASHLSASKWFGPIADVARVAGNLLELRHKADYDPGYTCDASDADLAIVAARQAIDQFKASTPDQQLAFLSLLLFKAR
jgi:hypothetical protein